MKYSIYILFLLLLFFIMCADIPEHTNIFDPNTPNEPPGGVELSPDLISYITDISITFSWTESGDDDFLKYKVYRSEQPGVDTLSTLIGKYDYPFLTTITDTSLQSNTPYHYTVYTEDKGGQMTKSNELKVSTTPAIYGNGQMMDDGNTEIIYHFGKMDVVNHNNGFCVAAATVTKQYNLVLYIRRYFNINNMNDWGSINYIELIEGDSDSDGEPDLFEIFADTDPYDADSQPEISHTDYASISPIQTIVMKETASPISILFVSFAWSRPYMSSKILKFVGSYDTEDYELDRDWHNNGVLKLGYPCCGNMDAYSSSQIVVINTDNRLTFFNVDDNGQTHIPQQSPWIGDISIGCDHPSGPKFIYLQSAENIVKLNEQGDILHSWQGITNTPTWLSSFCLYADNHGNVFIIDPDLATINHFTSQGEFVSRWYQVSHPVTFQHPFILEDVLSPFGQASIDGDGENNLFIIDQTPFLYRTQF